MHCKGAEIIIGRSDSVSRLGFGCHMLPKADYDREGCVWTIRLFLGMCPLQLVLYALSLANTQRRRKV